MSRHAEQQFNILTDPDCENERVYDEEMWKTLLQQEAEKPPIYLQSPQLEFRGTLVQQLRDVSKKLGLGLPTLHSAVAQLDLFMDAHRLRGDRLTHVALACLSIAAKSDEKCSRAPSLKALSKISGVELCGKVFRQLEWMVGQHIKWKLLAPTAVSFASLLAEFVVMEGDFTTRHPKIARRLKRDGAKLLNKYLDLTLSDVRLKLMQSVDVGCACVLCARTDLGLQAWPAALDKAAGRPYATIAPIARRLHRMMQVRMKCCENAKMEVDQYSSARTSPQEASSTSPNTQTSLDTNIYSSNICDSVTSYPNPPVARTEQSANLEPSAAPAHSEHYMKRVEYPILDMKLFSVPAQLEQNQAAVDMTCHRIDSDCFNYCTYFISNRLLNADLDNVQPTTGVVKRPAPDDIEYENKRHCSAPQSSQSLL